MGSEMNSKDKGGRGEIWKDVIGYEGLYQVSNLGRVKSLPKYHYKNCRILKQTIRKRDGRLSVMLVKSGQKNKRITIHRLVAIAFIDNPHELIEINHIDENPKNNVVENLEWCTRKYNMNYGTTPQRLNIKNKRPVIGQNEDRRVEFDAVGYGKKDGYDSSGIIRSIKLGIRYKGLYWRYVNDNQ